jgi:hypothetical protein
MFLTEDTGYSIHYGSIVGTGGALVPINIRIIFLHRINTEYLSFISTV